MKQWLAREYTIDPKSLGLHRFLFAYVLARFFVDRQWVAGVSQHLFHPPPGPMQLFSDFPSSTQVDVMVGLAWVAIACIVLGLKTWVAAVVFSSIAITLDGFAYSVEKVHHHILLYAAPLFLAFTPWGTRFSIDAWVSRDPVARSSRDRYWPLCFLALFIGAIFFSSAVLKLAGGWLDWDTQAARAHLVTRHIAGFNRGLLSKYASGFGSDWMWEIADWVTVFFEGAVIFSIVRLRWFRVVLAAACVFHFGMFLALEPRFADYVIVYAAFVDWSRMAVWWHERRHNVKLLLLLGILPIGFLGAWSLGTDHLKNAILQFGAAFGAFYLLVRFCVWITTTYRAWARRGYVES